MSERNPLIPTRSTGSGRTNSTSQPSNMLSQAQKVMSLTFYSSPVNYLLILLPFGLFSEKLGLSSSWVFSINFFAIISLASILAFATEELAEHVGETIGGLLNATFGNAVELIVSIIAIQQNQIRVVQASMLGSILSNLLLVLGCCFVIGGYDRLQQTFNQTVAQTMSSLLALSVIGLLLPAAFHASLPDPSPGSDFPNPGTSDDKILSLSRGTSIILLVIYILYLVFQLKTHKELFESAEQQLSAAQLQQQQQDNEQQQDVESHPGSSDATNKAINDDNNKEQHISLLSSIIILIITTVAVSFSADLLVGSIDDIVAKSGLSKTFIGLIIIPIVGNAAEHVTAVFVARKDKMDLAIGVAVGSSIQIALFVTPFMVLVGWIVDTPMSLFFSTFETAVMFVAVFITNYLILDGESNWLEGAMLLSTYLIVAISFFYYPDTIGN